MTLPVVAIIKAKPGKEADLEMLLRGLVARSHEEPGCLTYGLHRAQNEAGTFVFVEKWKDPADLGTHFGTPHIAEMLRRKDELIERTDVYPLTLIDAGDPAKSRF